MIYISSIAQTDSLFISILLDKGRVIQTRLNLKLKVITWRYRYMLHHHIYLRKSFKEALENVTIFFSNFLLRRPSGLFHMFPNSEVGDIDNKQTPVYSKSLNSRHLPVMWMPIWIYRLTTWFHFLKTKRFYRMKYFIGAKIIIHVIQRISVIFFFQTDYKEEGLL